MHKQKKEGRKKIAAKAIKDEDKTFLASFSLNSVVATAPFLYCWASHQEILEPRTKLTELHTEYQEWASEYGWYPVSYVLFSIYFS